MAAQPDFALRRVQPADAPALGRFYADLSPASRRARFLGACAGVSEDLSRSFCTPDHIHAEGFIAVRAAAPDDAGGLIGHLCLEPIDERRVELAVAVADEWQGRGIGRRLFEAALQWAAQHHFREIVATAYADNAPVLRLLSSAPHAATISPSDAGVVNVTIPLAAQLPRPWQNLSVAQSPARRGRRRSRADGTAPARRPGLVVWRRTRPPARGAAG